ncbi:MAG: type II secretion system GspH family protein [Synergistetes bacterium]|nr:type II secretion system GspH family protein [Synergistota bacterium]MCX8128256.1 type II secretion system GspH family protein [Synergistota bacterium]MDW8192703.1 type II secretion system protein [Synergistota bacterium]
MNLRRGLTLVEALVVIAILAIVFLVLMESLLGSLRVYRHGVVREDMLQNVRNALDRIRLEIVKGAIGLELITNDPRFVIDDNHKVLKIYFEDVDPMLIGCYRGRNLPNGESTYILGMLRGVSTLQPLTDGYDGGKDSYWISVEEFKVELLPGKNTFIYGSNSFINNGAFIYIKVAGPGGLETRKFKKSKYLEVSTIVYLRR